VQLREDRVDTGNAVASSPQSRNRLGERRSEGEESKKDRKGWGQESVKKAGAQEILEVEEGIWKKEAGKDAGMKDLGPCHRIKRGIYAKKGESILTIKRGKRGSTDICGRPVEKGIYLTLQVTPDITSTLCGEKG